MRATFRASIAANASGWSHGVRLEVAARLEAERPAQAVLRDGAVGAGHELRVALADVRAQDVLALEVRGAHVGEVRHVAAHVELELAPHAAEPPVAGEVRADEERRRAAARDGDEATGLRATRRCSTARRRAAGATASAAPWPSAVATPARRRASRAQTSAEDGGEDEQVGAHEQRDAEQAAREREPAGRRPAPRAEQRERRERRASARPAAR